MAILIGIRRETKPNEKRTPLTPKAVKILKEQYDIKTVIQPDKNRAYSDEEYIQNGAIIKEDLSSCSVIFGIKEIEPEFLKSGQTYMTFNHVIKGQSPNMPMLKHMININTTILDYETVVDQNNKRLIFFGKHAGYAGMIDIFNGLGKRLKEVDKIITPFSSIKQSCKYFDLDDANKALIKMSNEIKTKGFPDQILPIIVGFLGYGNVSSGAQTILDFLPVKEIKPENLADFIKNVSKKEAKHVIYKIVFREEHLVQPINKTAKFDKQTYFDHPELYEAVFAKNYLQYLTVIVNGAYWSKKYPRFITKKDLKELYASKKEPKLKMIGDISCDIEGGVESTIRVSYIDRPFYVYNPDTNIATDGVKGKGPVILAIDHLPTEIPRDSSEFFSDTLLPFVPKIAQANLKGTFDEVDFPEEIKKSVILWKGEFTPKYTYIKNYLQ